VVVVKVLETQKSEVLVHHLHQPRAGLRCHDSHEWKDPGWSLYQCGPCRQVCLGH
jgi:hypothetical protein